MDCHVGPPFALVMNAPALAQSVGGSGCFREQAKCQQRIGGGANPSRDVQEAAAFYELADETDSGIRASTGEAAVSGAE
jgi:hypothetical protein